MNLCHRVYMGGILCSLFGLLSPSVFSAAIYYSDGNGKKVFVELPVSTTTTINKNVSIYAPQGATVIYGDMPVYSETIQYPRYPVHQFPPDTFPYPPPRMRPASISLRPMSGLCLHLSANNEIFSGDCTEGERSEALYFHQGQVWYADRCLYVINQQVVSGSCNQSGDNIWLLAGRQLYHRASGLCLDADGGRLKLNSCSMVDTQLFH